MANDVFPSVEVTPSASKRPVRVDGIEQSAGLFYAYCNQIESAKSYVMVFDNVETCNAFGSKVGQILRREGPISDDSQRIKLFKRVAPQMFVCGLQPEESPSFLLNSNSDFEDFRERVIVSEISSGNFPVLPIQRIDGYVLGDKYVHSVPAALPPGYYEPDLIRQDEKAQEEGLPLDTIEYKLKAIERGDEPEDY